MERQSEKERRGEERKEKEEEERRREERGGERKRGGERRGEEKRREERRSCSTVILPWAPQPSTPGCWLTSVRFRRAPASPSFYLHPRTISHSEWAFTLVFCSPN